MREPASDPMAALRRAMEAQAAATGRIDVEAVDARLAEGDPIPPDDLAVAEERGDWREMLPDAPEQELSDAERAMIQPPLFDAEASRAARDRSMAQVDASADPEWKTVARGAIRSLIEDGDDFTADDVWARVGSYPVERRALGPLLKAEADAGSIENTGRRKNSERPEHHAYPMTVWRPVIRRTGERV